jgi:hypothetical protein
MKNKFKILDEVVVRETQKLVTVIDMEFFGDMILYYTSDKMAYPEDNLRHSDLLMCILSGEEITENCVFKVEKNIY